MTVQPLKEYLNRYAKDNSVVVAKGNNMTFDISWSLRSNEFVDTDGNYKVITSSKGQSKIKITNFSFALYCYQENGIPKECILYLKDSKELTVNKVLRELKRLF